MKQFKLAAMLFACVSLLSSPTFASSLMKDEAPLVSAAPYNWTGFYAGLNVGAVKHTMNITDNQAAAFFATLEQVSNPQFTGGFQVGYRRQLDLTKTSGVYGVEFSANYSDASFNKQYGSPFALYQLNAENELKSVCLLELMGGIAADRTLLFLTAGLSYVDISGNVTNTSGVPFFKSFNVGKNVIGTAVGAGAEYAFTDTISARFKLDVITPNVYTSSDNTGNTYQISNNIVQAAFGVNYKFR